MSNNRVLNPEDLVLDNNEESFTTRQIIKQLIPDIHEQKELKASEFINKYWKQYTEKYKSNQSINGKVFEYLIAIALIRSEIFPLYLQAHVAFIPGVDYDCIIYTEELGPISLSAKTSLRERWKQADLEALALKNIHRKSKSYLISMSQSEIKARKNNPAPVMALDDFILATSSELDDLLEEIKKYTIIFAPEVVAVNSKLTITSENYLDHF